MAIHFFYENTDFKITAAQKTKNWIKNIIKNENFEVGAMNFIFCDDQYLHRINMEYLQHDTYTDIITFDQSDDETKIDCEIFISIDRVKENAQNLQTTFENELKRVMIHGVWHILGFGDKTEEEAKIMRQKEDESLAIF